MAQVNDLSGKKFNHLTVIKSVGSNEHGKMMWEVQCDCGNRKILLGTAIKNGGVKSCGCIKNDGHSNLRHGMADSSEYNVWKGIIRRCKSEKWKQYKDYGGRGIYVVERWLKFSNFIEDMGRKPGPEYQIDRIDNDGPYCKENCRWTTAKINCNNKRDNRTFEVYNAKLGIMESLTLTEISEKYGIGYSTLNSRVNKLGKSIEEAIRTDVRKMKNPEQQVFELNGETLTLKEIAERHGMSYNTLYSRLYMYGMSLQYALTQPIRRR